MCDTDEIQCRECKGFGHILRDYVNTQLRKNKSMVVKTWSDDESDVSDDKGDKSNFGARTVGTRTRTEVVIYNTPEEGKSSDSNEDTT